MTDTINIVVGSQNGIRQMNISRWNLFYQCGYFWEMPTAINNKGVLRLPFRETFISLSFLSEFIIIIKYRVCHGDRR